MPKPVRPTAKLSFGKLLLGCAAATLLATPVLARIMHAQITGTVGYGFDETGLFGPPLGDLTGQAFVADFVYDTALGIRDHAPGLHDWVVGGTALGLANPLQRVTVDINAHSVSLLGHYFGSGGVAQDGYFFDSEERLLSPAFKIDTILMLELFGAVPFINVTAPVSLQSVYGGGPLQYYVHDLRDDSYPIAFNGYLDAQSLRIGAAVPEPANWALMIAGFSLVGTSLRRRHAVTA